jgi:hypothetical protein
LRRLRAQLANATATPLPGEDLVAALREVAAGATSGRDDQR